MTSSPPAPYSDARDAIKTMWADGWVPVEGVPVLWHENTADPTPSRATGTRHWLHLAVEFAAEGVAAYGGGPGMNEREIDGTVAIRVFAFRGIGDTMQMALLDSALRVFRSQRVGALSMIGDVTQMSQGASDDGAWWVKSGIASFLWRFQG